MAVTAETPLTKSHVMGYAELVEFMIRWKDFDSPPCQAFVHFVQAISHTFESGRGLKSDLEVININDVCAFAPPRVRQIWEDALKLFAPEDLKECVDAMFGLELPCRYWVGPYSRFSALFLETKDVWQDAHKRGNGIVIARY